MGLWKDRTFLILIGALFFIVILIVVDLYFSAHNIASVDLSNRICGAKPIRGNIASDLNV